MIEQDHFRNDGIAEFYDGLALDYDEMTGFEKRFIREKPFFRLLVGRFGINSALDAGCGTGFHSLLLSQLGVKVTAFDVSEEMLQITRRHASDMNIELRTLQASFFDIGSKLNERFDAVFCLGNSLVHLLSGREVEAALRNLHTVLRHDGVLFIQILNYARLLETEERIQSVKEAGGKVFVRFYDYEDERIRFNILTIAKKESMLTHSLRSVELLPIPKEEILMTMRNVGFSDVKLFGSISLEEFEAQNSTDLIVIGKKTAAI
jgi:SAM-dependent methyltransferase